MSLFNLLITPSFGGVFFLCISILLIISNIINYVSIKDDEDVKKYNDLHKINFNSIVSSLTTSIGLAILSLGIIWFGSTSTAQKARYN
jgi:hypothetical protein